jgi:hypothetical protein
MSETPKIQFKDISLMVEEFKSKHNVSYIESTIAVCEANGIEYETLKKGLSKNIKEKIEAEASSLRLLKYRNKTILDV